MVCHSRTYLSKVYGEGIVNMRQYNVMVSSLAVQIHDSIISEVWIHGKIYPNLLS